VAQLFWVEILLFLEKSQVPGYKHFVTMALLSVIIPIFTWGTWLREGSPLG
jgi:hypothetical protein